MQIDVRVEINSDIIGSDEYVEQAIKDLIMSRKSLVKSVVVLRNDGFARLLPDEKTRVTR